VSIKLDLHVHSESRGKVFITADQLKSALEKNHLDGVAITNFFDISHALWLKEKVKEYVVIVGQEIWTKDGHITGLGLKEKIPDCLNAEDTVSLIHKQGGIAVAVHPFLHLGVGKKLKTLPIDAIEVYNAVMGIFGCYQNYLAKSLAQKRKICPLASTDTTNPICIGRSYTEVMTDKKDLVLETIREGRVNLFKKALPIPLTFILKNILNFKNLEPCSTHAVPCLVCERSMSVRLFKKEFKCLDCGKKEMSRIACCNGHYICKECLFTRAKGNKKELEYKNILNLQEIEIKT